MNWAKAGALVRILYLLRVPILTLIILGGLGPLTATLRGVRAMLGGMLDMEGGPWWFFHVSWIGFQTASVAIATANLILSYGDARFRDPALQTRIFQQRNAVLIAVIGLLCPAVLLWYVAQFTELATYLKVIAAIGGLLAALFFAALATLVQAVLSDPASPHNPPPELVPLVRLGVAPFNRLVDRLRAQPRGGLRQWISKRLRPVQQRIYQIFEPGGEGYLLRHANHLQIGSGHVFMACLFFASTAAFVAAGLMQYAVISAIDPRQLPWLIVWASNLPALAYLLLAVMLGCFLFGSLTFFGDRYRMPSLMLFVLLALITGRAPEGAHFYRTEPKRVQLPPPGRFLEGKKRAVVIASAGGGIQAAAWTTKVLEGLEAKCAGCLQRSLAAMSGVSGGSTGIMHYGAHWGNPKAAFDSARSSSIEAVSWGLLNPDVRRAVFPWLAAMRLPFSYYTSVELDRGWALERAWEQRDGTADVFLSNWGQRAASGFPAFLFNATAVDSGAPFVFATSAIPDNTGRYLTFQQAYRSEHDVRVSTAVRLSASFPWVSPSARSMAKCLNCPDHRLVDGGYYDNYGVHTLLYWLDAALDQANTEQIMLVMIRSFPAGGPGKEGSPAGWFWQTYAPAEAYLNVRDTAQLSRTLRELELFRDSHAQEFQFTEIVFPPLDCGNDLPLNWKLRSTDLRCIEQGWTAAAESAGVKALLRFLQQ